MMASACNKAQECCMRLNKTRAHAAWMAQRMKSGPHPKLYVRRMGRWCRDSGPAAPDHILQLLPLINDAKVARRRRDDAPVLDLRRQYAICIEHKGLTPQRTATKRIYSDMQGTHHVGRQLLGVTAQRIELEAVVLHKLLENGMGCKPHPMPKLLELQPESQEWLRRTQQCVIEPLDLSICGSSDA